MSGLLLSPNATFLLGIAALLGTILHLGNPIKRELKKYRGKTGYQVEADFVKAWKKDRVNVIIEQLGSCQYSLLVLLYTFVIDPLVMITAISRNIGYQPLSYVMVIAWVIACFVWIHNIVLAVWPSKREHIAVPDAVSVVPNSWIALTDRIGINERTRAWIRRVFVYLPVFYYWYLLLVVLGIFH